LAYRSLWEWAVCLQFSQAEPTAFPFVICYAREAILAELEVNERKLVGLAYVPSTDWLLWSMRRAMDEAAVQAFWQLHPCGDQQVGGLTQAFAGDCRQFFREYDEFRYRREPHILRALDRFQWGGKRVLEIGIGQGADAEQLVRRGARWSGLDLTQASVERMRMRTEVHGLLVENIRVGSALDIPYSDQEFDVVFSHGVLHHIPEIRRAQAEIRRVLKPTGSLVMMVYAKHSLNYQVSIRIIRRLGLVLLMSVPAKLSGIYEQHRENARKMGLVNYLRLHNFVHRSTDGPENPYSKVYTVKEIERDFPNFRIAETFKLWMHAPPLPSRRLPGEHLLGWHLWARLEPAAGLIAAPG
jgi:ubiquinone/menaquinone biosynthesis C-methylase UbiE